MNVALVFVLLATCFTYSVNAQEDDPHSLPEYPVCGKLGKRRFRSGVGRFHPKLGQFPWMAALGYGVDKNAPEWKCDGVLITSRHILTAASCANIPDLFKARLGVLNRTDPGFDADIVAKHVHEEYNSETYTNDIALLKLDRAVGDSLAVIPACLPLSIELKAKKYDAHTPYITGWGFVDRDGEKFTGMLASQVLVNTLRDCTIAFRGSKVKATGNNMCAGSAQRHNVACDGNAGGGLAAVHREANVNHWHLIGVTVHGRQCDNSKLPNVFVKVAPYVDWIQSKIAVST